MILSILQKIANTCGIKMLRFTPVQGGDVNECYCLEATNGFYFLKLNKAKDFPNMFQNEAMGLQALQRNCVLIIPTVIRYGIADDRQWLLLEWLEKDRALPTTMADFGGGLAQLHQQTNNYFGWQDDNYIGSLKQVNSPKQSWANFYAQCRIMPLVSVLFERRILSKQEVMLAENFCKRAETLFPVESPALLHGDLWSGNYCITSGGRAAIFDPAVYYGHREMDLGMTVLFGGFSDTFYDAYNAVYPLEKDWQQRLPFTQAYPLMVHALLFGGHYIANIKDILHKS